MSELNSTPRHGPAPPPKEKRAGGGRSRVDEMALLPPPSPAFSPQQQLYLYTAENTGVEKGDKHALKLKQFASDGDLSPSTNGKSQGDEMEEEEDDGMDEVSPGGANNRRHPFRHLHFWRSIFWVQFAMILAIFMFVLVICVLSGVIVWHVRDAIDKANEAIRNNPLSNFMDKFRPRQP